MSLKIYDADQVTVAVAGIPLRGYADGEFLSIEQESENFTDVVGTDGEVSRSKTNDRRATVTITLMQTSESNDLLSALANLDLNATNGAGVGSFLVRDKSGRAVYTAQQCWIQSPPTAGFDRGATSREWTIRCAKLVRLDGGN